MCFSGRRTDERRGPYALVTAVRHGKQCAFWELVVLYVRDVSLGLSDKSKRRNGKATQSAMKEV